MPFLLFSKISRLNFNISILSLNFKPFLKEERILLNVIAEELGRFIREREVEEALKESESNLWQAQQLAKVGCWELNLKDGVFNMSDHMRFIYGLKEEEFKNIE